MTTKQQRTSFITTNFSVLLFCSSTWFHCFWPITYARRPKAASYKPQTRPVLPLNMQCICDVQGLLLQRPRVSEKFPLRFQIQIESQIQSPKHICTRFSHSYSYRPPPTGGQWSRSEAPKATAVATANNDALHRMLSWAHQRWSREWADGWARYL